ncbi:hypothetical protein BGAL_0366g00140 [Botrytis galanthina]|uniref:Uncharacterized protein n=1 Tax=Botrytis galanthina TaxID=278940 RepID=A0A4S8QNQ0_9HELO|nr:hypothetical protein BGAL_0366g00140 [Botrytis galanthina]
MDETKSLVYLKYGSMSSIRGFRSSYGAGFLVVKHVYHRCGNWRSRAWIGSSEKKFVGEINYGCKPKAKKRIGLTKDEYDFEECLSRIQFGLYMVKGRSLKDGIRQAVDEDSEEYSELNSGDNDEEPEVSGADSFVFSWPGQAKFSNVRLYSTKGRLFDDWPSTSLSGVGNII